MIRNTILSLAVLATLASTDAAHAQDGPPTATIDAAGRRAVITALTGKLQANYVFPEVATSVSAALRAKDAAAGYASATDAEAFANTLSKDLRELGKDGHFRVSYAPGAEPRPSTATPGAEELAAMRSEMARHAYGIQRVERLDGNIGYLEIRGFGPTDLVGEAYSAAIGLLSGTEALILDLRRNGGGEPESVAYLLSHFFAPGDERHLNDIYTRPGDSTRQYWTLPVPGTRYLRPVYVLTSPRTFSGGEECAYDFQTQKRGLVVGEITGGGANPGDDVALGHGFIAFIPTGRAINPVTKTNWEHVGVKPDIAVPAADALKTAHAAAVKTQIAASKQSDEVDFLRDLLAKIESGVVETPVYSARR